MINNGEYVACIMWIHCLRWGEKNRLAWDSSHSTSWLGSLKLESLTSGQTSLCDWYYRKWMTDEGRLMYVYLCGCVCGVREGRRVVGRARVLRGDEGWERDGEILQNWHTKVIESFIYNNGWQAGDPGK